MTSESNLPAKNGFRFYSTPERCSQCPTPQVVTGQDDLLAVYDAETELATLRREAEGTLPPLVRSAIVRLGELRRRQGRLDEAAESFANASDHKLAILGRAALALDRKDPSTATELMEASLRRLPGHTRTERLAALEILVRATLMAGDHDRARVAAGELRAIADAVGNEPVRGAAQLSEGLVAAATGDTDTAKRLFEDAGVCARTEQRPDEAARHTLELARVLAGQGRTDAAREAATRAAQAFRTMDVGLLVEEAEALVGDGRAAAHPAGDLTSS